MACYKSLNNYNNNKKSPLSVIKPSLNTFWDIPVVEELPFGSTQLTRKTVAAKDS